MATYEETVVLKDNVSGPARAASESVSLLGKSIADIGTGLLRGGTRLERIATAANSALAPVQALTNAVGALAASLASVGSAKLPKMPAASAPPQALAPPSPVAAPAKTSAPTLASPSAGPISIPPIPPPVVPPPVFTPPTGPAPVPPVSPAKVPVVVDSVAAVQSFKTLTSSVKANENAMVKAAAVGDMKAFGKAKGNVDSLKNALSQLPPGTEAAAASTKSLSQSWWNARNVMDVGRQTISAAIAGIGAAFSSLAKGDVRGVVKGITDSIAGMAKMLDLVVPGLGQAVSAVISVAGGLAGAFAGITVDAMKFAVASSQAKQQMLSMFDAMGDGKVSGAELDDMLSSLSDQIGITKDKLAPLTKGFLQMGVTGKEELEKLTKAAISATAIVGSDAGAQAFTELQKKIALAAETGGKFQLSTKQLLNLREAGVGVSDIAAKMGMSTKALTDQLTSGAVDAKKFGDALTDAVIARGAKPLETLSSSFGAIKEKFMQSIGDMFEDIDVGPFMTAVKDLFSIFGQSTSSGQTLKAGIAGGLQAIFNAATKVVPIVKGFLLDMVIWGLKAYIALKPIVEKVREFFASATGSALLSTVLDGLWQAFKGIAVVLGVVIALGAGLVAWVVACAAAGGALVGTLMSIAATLAGAVFGAISGAGAAIAEFASGILAPFEGLPERMMSLGGSLIDGLINGVTAKFEAAKNTITNLGQTVLSAFSAKTETRSPSMAFARLGGFLGDGLTMGMEAKAPDVHAASSNLGNATVKGTAAGMDAQSFPAAMSGAGGPGQPTTDNSSRVTVHIDTLEVNGVRDAAELGADEFKTKLSLAFESLGLMAAVPAT